MRTASTMYAMLTEVTHPMLPSLSAADACRAIGSFEKLCRHEIGDWALTGSLALDIHAMRLGMDALTRTLNDLDFVAGSFERLAETLAQDFLFRHVHPLARSGKTMAQLIDPQNALRIDVFQAQGATMDRTVRMDLPGGPLRVVSLEDLVARAARLLLDLAEGVPAARKHARDYVRFAECVRPDQVEAAWGDHRKPAHPDAFRQAKAVLRDLLPISAHLLMVPRYSHDPNAQCPLCAPNSAFPLADPQVVLSLLGYC
jgi:hypothetical protein